MLRAAQTLLSIHADYALVPCSNPSNPKAKKVSMLDGLDANFWWCITESFEVTSRNGRRNALVKRLLACLLLFLEGASNVRMVVIGWQLRIQLSF